MTSTKPFRTVDAWQRKAAIRDRFAEVNADLSSAAWWLCDWAVRFRAQDFTDPGVAAYLDEIVRENLGWLDIQELPEHARTTVAANRPRATARAGLSR
jgi:hypothetical protein